MNDRGTALPPKKAPINTAMLALECNECRLLIESDWQFCAHCEERLSAHCPRCGVAMPPAGSVCCGHCGLALARAGGA